MRITEIITGEKPSLSFEVFPPKTTDTFASVRAATEKIAALSPSYMSVTYGAGGGTSAYTLSIARNLQENFGVPMLTHLTCVSSTHAQIRARLEELKAAGLTNLLALRGDLPEGLDRGRLEYRYAAELIAEIRAGGDDFCIGGACYPETHPESRNSREDIRHLKEKVDAGCDFLTTQMFFDNDVLYNFLYRIREAGITVPVVAGVMPVTSAQQLRRVKDISAAALPQRFVRIVDHFGTRPAAMKQAGIAFATEQVVDLFANGINAVHIYSMNHPDVAAAICSNLSAVLR